MKKVFAVLLAGSLLVSRFVEGALAVEAQPLSDPVENYREQKIEGWRVRVNQRLLAGEQKELADATLKVLGEHLFRITRVIPAGPLARLREIPIWVELNHPLHPCMCYHPAAGWLRANGMNPAKAGTVEIANAKNFLDWTHDQPWMVLHELAHGYHHRFLGGYDNPEIKACYERAVAAKSYESVLRANGRRERHYALTNPQEYFAEATEAFFGTNDFFPFVRAELREHDPAAHELLSEVWEVKPAKRD